MRAGGRRSRGTMESLFFPGKCIRVHQYRDDMRSRRTAAAVIVSVDAIISWSMRCHTQVAHCGRRAKGAVCCARHHRARMLSSHKQVYEPSLEHAAKGHSRGKHTSVHASSNKKTKKTKHFRNQSNNNPLCQKASPPPDL